jgi:hypothetical protein
MMIRKRDLTHGAQYVQDLVKLVTHSFDHPSSLFKFRVLNSVRKRTNSRALVETGTFQGDTSRRSAKVFERVVTIELDPTLAAEAKKSLGKLPNVEVLEGDALALLPEILKTEGLRDILVFLDGHASGGSTACGDLPEPACHELGILEEFSDKLAAIVIDDFRCFGTVPGFPSKLSLVEAVERFIPLGFTYTVQFDQVIISRVALQS